MKVKVVPSVLAVFVVVVLCAVFYRLGAKSAAGSSSDHVVIEGVGSGAVVNRDSEIADRTSSPAGAEVVVPAEKAIGNNGKRKDIEAEQRERLMRNISENLAMPGMNQIIQEQQRVLMADKYGRLIKSFGLDEQEEEYFLDLLTARQMLQVNMGMKLMTGMLSEEERAEMMQSVGSGMDELQKEINWFLNSESDSDFLSYYDKTEGERATIESVGDAVRQAGHPFADGVDEELVGIMYEKLTSHSFSVNLEEDGQPVFENFTEDNINIFLQELEGLRVPVVEEASTVLDPEQLEVFSEYYDQYVAFFEQRLQMARQFFNPSP